MRWIRWSSHRRGDTQVTLGNVVIKFTVSELPAFQGVDSHDYSGIPTGPSYRPSADYPAETNFLNYPAFSWNVVQRWGTMDSARRLTAAEAGGRCRASSNSQYKRQLWNF